MSWLTDEPTNGIGTSRPPPVIVVRSLPALLKASRTPPNSDVGFFGSKLSALSRSARAGSAGVTVTSLPVMPSARSATFAVTVSFVELTPWANASAASSTETSTTEVTEPASFWEKTSRAGDTVPRTDCWRTCSTKAGTGVSPFWVRARVCRCWPVGTVRSRLPVMDSAKNPLVVLICTGELIVASATSRSRGDWRSRTRSLVRGREVMTRASPPMSTCLNGHGSSRTGSGLQSSLDESFW